MGHDRGKLPLHKQTFAFIQKTRAQYDALAKKGVLYRNAFSNGPVCAISRFGILTGVYAESCSPAQHMRANAHLPKELKTYPQYLREAGYYCANNWKEDWNCDAVGKEIWDDSSHTAQWYHRPPGKPFMAHMWMIPGNLNLAFSDVTQKAAAEKAAAAR